ncbi:flippase [Nodosilinea sp. LEGE 07088]|uniref:flippase n=1 Tax=Nodosilinea sp. LEGE 07088 TaxID=2777968 RepID=UPI0018807D46|nr:flippase [Nodosilinea sp. LEGE 07088]MBE9137701.1 flippase [Nodosilinea sp. LEGE 07088]
MMLKNIISKVQDKLKNDKVFSSLLRGSSVVLLIQILGRGIGYFDQIILARWMGATDYGFYIYIISWATLVTTLPKLGQRGSVVRFIPEFRIKEEPGRLKGVVQGSLGMTALVSVGLALIGTAIAFIFESQGQTINLQATLIGIWVMPLMALVDLSMSILQGFRRMAAAFIPLTLVRPMLVLIGASSIYFWVQDGTPLSTTTVLCITFISFVVILLQLQWMIHREVRAFVGDMPAIYEIRRLLRVSLPLLLATGFGTILVQSDIVMIGLIKGPEDVGFYNAAVRTAAIIGFLLTAVSAAVGPMISAAYAEGEPVKLQRLITKANQILLIPSLAIVVAVIFLSEPLLRNFGPEFVSMRWVLIVLALGQFVKASSGPIGLLLDLTGHQDESARLRGMAACLNISLNLIGIYTLGALGAALATLTSIIFERAYIDYVVVKHVNVSPSWFSSINRRLQSITRQ